MFAIASSAREHGQGKLGLKHHSLSQNKGHLYGKVQSFSVCSILAN